MGRIDRAEMGIEAAVTAPGTVCAKGWEGGGDLGLSSVCVLRTA